MMQGPKRVTSVLLGLVILTSGHQDYWSYSQDFYKVPNIWMDVVWGTASAPSQYRIGVVDTAYFLARQLHLGMRHTLALLDIIAAFITVFTLFLVLRRSTVYRESSLAGQWVGATSFVILVQFYFAWLLWYQKPETLPTAAILALALLLLTIKLPLPETAGQIGAVIGLLLLAVAQGLVRADVGFALHAGILLVCLTPAGKGFALPRRVQAATSFVALVLVLGIQYYLMMRKYRHATYGDTPVLQLFYNLGSLQGYIPFVLFMAPLVCDHRNAGATAVSGWLCGYRDVRGCDHFYGDVGNGGEIQRGPDLPAVRSGAGTADGGVGDAALFARQPGEWAHLN